MKLKKIIFVVIFSVLASCNNNVREISADIDGQKTASSQIKSAEAESGNTDQVIEYSVLIGLLDSVSSDELRQDGIQRLTSLRAKTNNSSTISLDSMALFFDELMLAHPLQNQGELIDLLSKAYEKNDEKDAALLNLNKLVIQYPNISNYDQAQFRRGEILFDKRQFKRAENAYKQVIQYKVLQGKSAYYERAVYKQGMSQLKQSQFNAALNSFMHILDLHAQNGDINVQNLSASEQVFIADVMQKINLVFLYQAGPISASAYFSSRPKGTYEDRIFSSLADFYRQKKYFTEAVKTYRLFVSSNVMHEKSPVFLLEVIDIYKQGGFSELLLEARKDFVLRYGIKSLYWGIHKARELTEIRLALKNNINQLISYYQEKARQTKNPFDYLESLRWYRIWLNSFPNDPAVWNMRLQFAEILNTTKHYESAILQYESLAYDYKLRPKSSEAAYSALLMYVNREKELKGFAKRLWHAQALSAALHFVKQFPEFNDVENVLPMLVGLNNQKPDYELLLKKNSYVEKQLTDAGLSQSSVLNMGVYLTGARDWNKAVIVLNRLKEVNSQQALRPEITKRLALIYFANGDLGNASLEYEKLSYMISETDSQISALWLAAELSEQVNDYKRAAKMYVAFLKRFPLSLERSIETVQRLIDLYQRNEEKLLATQWRVELINADAKGGQYRTERTRYLAARASYILAEPVYESYRNVSLNHPLNEALQQKINVMNKVLTAFNRAASYGVPEVRSASNYRKAEIYRDIRLAIKNMESFEGFKGQEYENYNAFIKEQLIAFKAKEIEFHEFNVSRFRKGLRGPWIWKSFERLNVLLPMSYKKVNRNDVMVDDNL